MKPLQKELRKKEIMGALMLAGFLLVALPSAERYSQVIISVLVGYVIGRIMGDSIRQVFWNEDNTLVKRLEPFRDAYDDMNTEDRRQFLAEVIRFIRGGSK